MHVGICFKNDKLQYLSRIYDYNMASSTFHYATILSFFLYYFLHSRQGKDSMENRNSTGLKQT